MKSPRHWAEADRLDFDLRLYVLDAFAEASEIAQIDGKILVENMEHVFQWVRNHQVPERASAARSHTGRRVAT